MGILKLYDYVFYRIVFFYKKNGATIYFEGRGFYDLTQYSMSFLIRSMINPGNQIFHK